MIFTTIGSAHLQLFWWVITRLGSSRQPRAVAYGVWVCITTYITIIIIIIMSALKSVFTLALGLTLLTPR